MADKPQHPPTIELDGARLRPLRVADAAALYAYLRDPIVTELTSYPVVSVPMVEAMIERSLSWAAGEPVQMWSRSSTMTGVLALRSAKEWFQRPLGGAGVRPACRPEWARTGWHRRGRVLRWTFRLDEVDRVNAFVRVNKQAFGWLARAPQRVCP